MDVDADVVPEPLDWKGTQRRPRGVLDDQASAFSLFLLLVSSELFSKSTSLQEQLLQLLNSSVQIPASSLQRDKELPRLSHHQLLSLTHAMSSPGCSTKVMERATALLKTLALDPKNLVASITHFISEVQVEATKLRLLLEKLPLGGDASPAEIAAAIAGANFAPHDVKFLRLARVLRSLWPGYLPRERLLY